MMIGSPMFPGTPRRQALLRSVVDYYAEDPRILALAVFGSLGRGDWDRHSDLDLDAVIAEGIHIDVMDELHRLSASFEAIGERAVLIIPDRDDAGHIVMDSLMGLSIRFHPLASTSPNIVESFRLLVSRIDQAEIIAAGLANATPKTSPAAHRLDQFVRLAIYVDGSIQRERLWQAIQGLHQMREIVLDLFANTRGGARPYHTFDAQAPARLQDQLGATLPGPTLASVREVLLVLLNLVEQNPHVIDPSFHLSEGQYQIIAQVQQRQA